MLQHNLKGLYRSFFIKQADKIKLLAETISKNTLLLLPWSLVMARTIIVLAVLLFVEGFAFPPEFIPTTMRGVECKSECTMGHKSCRANPYRQSYI
jgi:hypothetical protein